MPPIYTTKRQRSALAEAGIEHEKGRKHWDAESLIDQCIRDGRLPANIRDRAWDGQLVALRDLEVEHDPKITKNEASDLIALNSPPTQRQLEFLTNLGAEIPEDLNKKIASDLLNQLTRKLAMSENQAQFIYKLGGEVNRSMTYANAKKFIDFLLDNELRCSRCNGVHNRRSDRCTCGAFIGNNVPLKPHQSLRREQGPATGEKSSFYSLIQSIIDCFKRD